jgi:hypothetical protein
VFDVILKKAHALCGSSHGALFLSDGERFMPAAMSSEGRFRGLVQFSLRTGDCLRQHLHCSGRVAAGIEKVIPLEDLGSLALKGISQPVSAFNVPLAATQPALRVIEGAPPSG